MLYTFWALIIAQDHEIHVGWIYLVAVLNMGESRKYARKL